MGKRAEATPRKQDQEPQVLFEVRPQENLEADPPLFANFVAVAHAGTEVQFEFVFLDLNQVATAIQAAKATLSESGSGQPPTPIKIEGRTVAKIVMPVAAFRQVKNHLMGMFEKFEKNDSAKQ